VDEPRLTDPRLTHDLDDAAAAAIPEVREGGKIAIAPHERG